ncbi:hypothetical protein, partial [Methylacidimicrobium cyclopophantes]|uniref:hypothetical protein n=1 Tax=Methylacidimicrobium cyclopophantes TaxID=1041766 RepID=UPI0015B785F2
MSAVASPGVGESENTEKSENRSIDAGKVASPHQAAGRCVSCAEGPPVRCERASRAELPALVLGASLLAMLVLGAIGWWSQARRAPQPVAAPIPASLADDEPHSFARVRSDYDRWEQRVIRWLREGEEITQVPRLDPALEGRALPPIEAARACLQRHLHRRVTIDSLEPIGYESREGG